MTKEQKTELMEIIDNLVKNCDGAQMCSERREALYEFAGNVQMELADLKSTIHHME